jgi:hypothetical protein
MDMTGRAFRFFITLAIAAGGATMVNAQAGPGSAAPLPGTGDSGKMSSANRNSNAEYNHLIGAGDPKSGKSDERPVRRQAAVPATAADIKVGASLRDSQGARIGTIDSVDADGAVVSTGQTKIKVPMVAFGKDDQGILLGITAARFNELIAKAKGGS